MLNGESAVNVGFMRQNDSCIPRVFLFNCGIDVNVLQRCRSFPARM